MITWFFLSDYLLKKSDFKFVFHSKVIFFSANMKNNIFIRELNSNFPLITLLFLCSKSILESRLYLFFIYNVFSILF